MNGDRFWRWLRGEDIGEPPTHRGSVGHSHVLEPEFRTKAKARMIAQKLVCKAVLRLRKMDYWASRMTLSVKFSRGHTQEFRAKFEEAQDTPTFLKIFDALWQNIPSGNPFWLGVTLHGLVPADRHVDSLWEDGKRKRLSSVVDKINEKYGRETLNYAVLQATRGKAPTRIPYNWVPELSEF